MIRLQGPFTGEYVFIPHGGSIIFDGFGLPEGSLPLRGEIVLNDMNDISCMTYYLV